MITETPLDILTRWRARLPEPDGLAAIRAEANDLLTTAADDPEVVTICAAVREPDDAAAELGRLAAIADDRRGLRAVVDALIGADSIGVVSDGPLTTDVLIDVVREADGLLPLVTDRPSVARGLATLGMEPMVDDPAAADRLLVPALAVHGRRIWSSASVLAVADRATRADPTAVVVHARPLAHLKTAARRLFRPPPWAADAADERWSFPGRPE